MRTHAAMLAAGSPALVLSACAQTPAGSGNPVATAQMKPTAGNAVSGTVRFEQVGGKVVVTAVLAGMKPTDPPVEGPKNNPMMPVVWLRDHKGESGNTSKIVTTTMGAAAAWGLYPLLPRISPN